MTTYLRSPKHLFLKLMLVSYQTYKITIVLDIGGLHAMVTRGGGGGGGGRHTPLYGQYGDGPLDRALSENRI